MSFGGGSNWQRLVDALAREVLMCCFAHQVQRFALPVLATRKRLRWAFPALTINTPPILPCQSETSLISHPQSLSRPTILLLQPTIDLCFCTDTLFHTATAVTEPSGPPATIPPRSCLSHYHHILSPYTAFIRNFLLLWCFGPFTQSPCYYYTTIPFTLTP